MSLDFSILFAFLVSLGTTIAACWVFTRTVLTRIYTLECDVADLQERHLRTVRKAAADKRWSGEEAIDESLNAALTETQAAKPKGWTKWGSSKSSN